MRASPERPRLIPITPNFNDLVARHALARTERAIATAVERLSTGKKINRAADDPAGLIAADTLAARRKSLETEIHRSEFAAHYLGAAEGGLSVIQDMLQELNGLTVASANKGALGEGELEAHQIEANAILDAIDFVTQTTVFNGQKILLKNGGFELQDTYYAVGAIDPSALGAIWHAEPPHKQQGGEEDPPAPAGETRSLKDVRTGRSLNFIDGDTEEAQKVIEGALKTISGLRGQIGSLLKYTHGSAIDAKRVELENTTEAESQIRDADFGVEISNLFRADVLRDAGLLVLQQVRQQTAQTTLTLLG